MQSSQPLPGAHLIQPTVFRDARGDFVKTFQAEAFAELGIIFNTVEVFSSTSHRGVVRGMHLQLPPYDHEKIIYCIRGRVLDVILDLRRNSPTFGKASAAELDRESSRVFFLPNGFAHGYVTLEDHSIVVYQTSSSHAPSHDGGVRWDSFDFDWGVANPIVSDRDRALPALADFNSPF